MFIFPFPAGPWYIYFGPRAPSASWRKGIHHSIQFAYICIYLHMYLPNMTSSRWWVIEGMTCRGRRKTAQLEIPKLPHVVVLCIGMFADRTHFRSRPRSSREAQWTKDPEQAEKLPLLFARIFCSWLGWFSVALLLLILLVGGCYSILAKIYLFFLDPFAPQQRVSWLSCTTTDLANTGSVLVSQSFLAIVEVLFNPNDLQNSTRNHRIQQFFLPVPAVHVAFLPFKVYQSGCTGVVQLPGGSLRVGQHLGWRSATRALASGTLHTGGEATASC